MAGGEEENEAENKYRQSKNWNCKKIWENLKTDREEGDRRSRFIFINLFSPLWVSSHVQQQSLRFFRISQTSVKHQIVLLYDLVASIDELLIHCMHIGQFRGNKFMKQWKSKNSNCTRDDTEEEHLINLIPCLERLSNRLIESGNFIHSFSPSKTETRIMRTRNLHCFWAKKQ